MKLAEKFLINSVATLVLNLVVETVHLASLLSYYQRHPKDIPLHVSPGEV